MLALTERLVLDAMEPRWKARGYTLIREPTEAEVPNFFGGFRPDAIAVGRAPSLLIEVKRPGGEIGDYKLAKLQELLKGRNDWRLEILYAASEAPLVEPVATEWIGSTLVSATQLSPHNPQAAFLLAWAALQAALTRRFPIEAKGPISAPLLALLDGGDIDQDEHQLLLGLSRKRNALAHGQLDMPILGEDVAVIVDLADRILAKDPQP
ncbi:hypothetical protein [Jiella sonneratiae]|uniref:REase AHJR-like domain-containing protein n=1 Tax=Jiella sonneratiae TaxID=2816856 RepID=A0ABS3J4G7_9HYPH|nr:hypothetical protein [Jiella sonneratiae]MBO0903967.1 hypothetical protein [Jiella sonneratiae]